MPYWFFVADYSGTPLSAKLGIDAESMVVVLHAPPDFDLVAPAGATIRRQAKGRADVVVAFYTQRLKLERQIDTMSQMIAPSGGLWIAWPKKSSGVETDMSDHVVRDVALPIGLVDNKVCAIDATWTALRLVWRSMLRANLP